MTITTEQRAEALRLAAAIEQFGGATAYQAAALLRTLAAQQAQAEPVAAVAWVSEFFKKHGFYPSPAQAYAAGSLAAAPAVRAPLTEAHVAAVVRSVQPCLSDESKAWRNQSAECRYWLEADRAVTQEQTR